MTRTSKLAVNVPVEFGKLIKKPKKRYWLIFTVPIIVGVLSLFFGINYYQYQVSVSNVLRLQTLLAQRGFNPGQIDGEVGAATKEAIVSAQTFYKLEATGIADSKLIAALEADTYSFDITPTDTTKVNRSVAELQQLLSDRGFYGGAIDGIPSSMTKEAIILAQKTYGLIPDGTAGSSLIAALEDGLPTTKDVFEVQVLLKEKGFYNGDINGLLTNETRNAIVRAQKFYQISPANGLPNKKLIDSLKS